MARKRLKRASFALAVVAGLLLGQGAACVVLTAWLGKDRPNKSAPTVELEYTQRDMGPVRQGVVLQTSFPVTNVGSRRLILIEKTRACCGRSTQQRETLVPPGGSTALEVRVDTSQWCGRLREVVHYATNDPRMPRLSLRVNADVVPGAGHGPEATPGNWSAGSVLP